MSPGAQVMRRREAKRLSALPRRMEVKVFSIIPLWAENECDVGHAMSTGGRPRDILIAGDRENLQ